MQDYVTCTHPGCGLITIRMQAWLVVHVVGGSAGLSTQYSDRGGRHAATIAGRQQGSALELLDSIRAGAAVAIALYEPAPTPVTDAEVVGVVADRLQRMADAADRYMGTTERDPEQETLAATIVLLRGIATRLHALDGISESEPRLDIDEAIRRAILFTLQLSNNEYKRLAALGPHSFIRALEQDGYTVVAAPTAPAAPGIESEARALDGDR